MDKLPLLNHLVDQQSVLPPENLIDGIRRAEGLKLAAAELRLTPARAPRTAQWLKEWELAATQLQTGTEDL